MAEPNPLDALIVAPAAGGMRSPPPPAAAAGGNPLDALRLDAPEPPQPNIMQRAWRSITGEGSTEFPDMPELTQYGEAGPFGGQFNALADRRAWLLSGGYLAAGGKPDAMADIARKTLPGSTVSQDRYGNPIIEWEGKRYYVNKPGLSMADVGAALVPTALAIAASRGGGAVTARIGAGAQTLAPGAVRAGATGAGNMLIRMGAQGAGQAAASLGQDAAAVGQGSEQGVSGHDALWAGVGGAVGEPIAAAAGALGGWIGRKIGAAWGGTWRYRGNMLGDAARDLPDDTRVTPELMTRTGNAVLARAEAEPGDFTVGQMRQFQDIVGRAGNDLRTEAAKLGDRSTAEKVGLSVRTGIPLTTGQATGQEAQLALEDRLRNTAPTKELFDRWKAGQAQAVDAAAGRLVPGAQQGAVPGEAEAGNALMQRLQARQQALARATTDAYAELPSLTALGMATGGGPSVTYNSGVSSNILGRLRQLHMGTHIQDDWAAAQRARELIAQTITVPAEGEAPGVAGVAAMSAAAPPPVTAAPFNLGAADGLLRDLGGAYSAAKTDAEKRAIARMTDEIHGAMDAGRMNGLISGDENLIAQWQTARASRRATGTFMAENDPIVNKFMDRATSGDLSGQEIVNALYGASEIGGGRGTMQVLEHLRSTYGTGSPEWEAVRAAAARRMVYGRIARDVPGQDVPGIDAPGKAITRLTNGLTGGGRELTEMLFTEAERGEMATVRDALQEVVKGNKRNTSGTAYTLLDNTAQTALGRLFRRWGPTAALVPSKPTGEAEALHAMAGRLTPELFRMADTPLGVFARRGAAPIAGGLLGPDVAPGEQ